MSIFIRIPKYHPDWHRRSLKELERTNQRTGSEAEEGNRDVQTVRGVSVLAGIHTISLCRKRREKGFLSWLGSSLLCLLSPPPLCPRLIVRKDAGSTTLKARILENVGFFSSVIHLKYKMNCFSFPQGNPQVTKEGSFAVLRFKTAWTCVMLRAYSWHKKNICY